MLCAFLSSTLFPTFLISLSLSPSSTLYLFVSPGGSVFVLFVIQHSFRIARNITKNWEPTISWTDILFTMFDMRTQMNGLQWYLQPTFPAILDWNRNRTHTYIFDQLSSTKMAQFRIITNKKQNKKLMNKIVNPNTHCQSAAFMREFRRNMFEGINLNAGCTLNWKKLIGLLANWKRFLEFEVVNDII